jgi:hypothetical protein
MTPTNMTAAELAAWEARQRGLARGRTYRPCKVCRTEFETQVSSTRTTCGKECSATAKLEHVRRLQTRRYKQTFAKPITPSDHAHHWRIDPPAGPTSTGRCRTCGAERAFSNVHLEDAAYDWRSLERRKPAL